MSADRSRRVLELFDALVDLGPSQRQARLDEACGADLALRDEVASLLAAAGEANTNAVLPPIAGLVRAKAAPADEPDLVGQRVLNYEIVAKLGQGGMGVVYLARHVHFPRQAALKVLRLAHARDPGVVQRFLNEARAVNLIRHPGIVDIVDAGVLPSSGAPYLLLEYLLGESLGSRLRRRGRIDRDEALAFAAETASALAAAHAKGIVHRDIKPENLFLAETHAGDARPKVKVLDFGVAKLRDAGNRSRPTAIGSVLGTPRYMSPEQWLDASTTDPRSDVYSLGVVLYEMLCGKVPFAGDDFLEVRRMHLMEDPAPLSQHDRSLPASLEATVRKAMAKRPEDRFASMDELRVRLEEHRREPPPPQRAAPRVQAQRRPRWIWLAGPAFIAALAAGAAALFGDRPRRPAEPATADARTATPTPASVATPSADADSAPAPPSTANPPAPPPPRRRPRAW